MLRRNPENVWHVEYKLPAMLLKGFIPYGTQNLGLSRGQVLSQNPGTPGKQLPSFLLPGYLRISGPQIGMAMSAVDYHLGVCWAPACSIPSTHKKGVDVDRCDPVMSAFRFLQKNLSLKLTQFLNGWIMECLLELGITFRFTLWSSVSSGH